MLWPGWSFSPGRALLIAAVVGLLVVPLQLALVPLLNLHNQVGIGQSFLGIWLAHTGFGLPLAILSVAQLPWSACRATSSRAPASTGATDFQIFVKIVLPAVLPRTRLFRDLPVPVDLERPSGGQKVFLPSSAESQVMTVKIADDLLGSARRRLGHPGNGGFRVYRRAAACILHAATLSRARPSGRLGEGWLTA